MSSNKRRRDRVLVGALCSACAEPMIYVLEQRRPPSATCPPCWSRLVSGRLFDLSLKLAFAVGDLEAAAETLPDRPKKARRNLRRTSAALANLRDELAAAAGRGE